MGRIIPSHCLETLIHAYVSSRIDFCNILLHDHTDQLQTLFQSVHNACAKSKQPILQVIQPIWWFHLSIIYTQFGCINLEQLYSHIGCIKTESSDWLIIIHPYWEYNLNENILAAPTPNMLPHPLNNNKVSFGVVISC